MHVGVVVAVEQRKIRPVLVVLVRNISLAFVIVEREEQEWMPWNGEMWREPKWRETVVFGGQPMMKEQWMCDSVGRRARPHFFGSVGGEIFGGNDTKGSCSVPNLGG
jgi:hypothetical protein